MAYRRGSPLICYTPSFLPFGALYWTIIGLVAFVCSIGFGLRVKGRRNLRRARRAILVSNHTLVMDPGVIACALWPRRTYFTMLEETARFPVLGTFVRLLGGVPIPESAVRLRTLQRAVADGVREIGYVHFFPEGECYLWNQRPRPFQPGAFFMAELLGLPVLPMAIVLHERGGALRAAARLLGSRIRVPPRVTVVIGEPVAPLALADHARLGVRGSELAMLVRRWMQKTIEGEGGTATLFRGQMPRLAKASREAQALRGPAEESRLASGQ